jgi:hypothetical protein
MDAFLIPYHGYEILHNGCDEHPIFDNKMTEWVTSDSNRVPPGRDVVCGYEDRRVHLCHALDAIFMPGRMGIHLVSIKYLLSTYAYTPLTRYQK